MTPKSHNQFHKFREDKKALIMLVALNSFADEGYFKTSIVNISRHAGISKGLMYNYFASKEDLLISILNKSIGEISRDLNLNSDGSLSEDEFEAFIRKLFSILREKIQFWRLLSQLLIQKDVRVQFLNFEHHRISSEQVMYVNHNNAFLGLIHKMISNYFTRKKDRKPDGYDHILDMNLFIYTIEGFARITIYQDEVDEKEYLKTVNSIIDLFK